MNTPEYDPEIDNCADEPGCGDERVLFNWYGPMICCPRCYANIFGGQWDGPIMKIPVAA